MCVQCALTCSACNSTTICTACKTGYFLSFNNSCNQNCELRQFINITSSLCQMCPYDCLTCNAASECDPSIGFYENNIAVSAACPTCCATCISDTICTSCLPNCFLDFNFSCLTSCPERSFKNTIAWKCVTCPYDCLACDSSRNCINCS